MKSQNLFTQDVIQFLKKSIQEAGGNEVFFTGLINPEGIVTSVKVGSRGNEHTVNVNFSHTENQKF